MTLTLFKVLLLTCFPGRSSDSYQIIPSLLAFPQSSFPVIVAAWTLSFEMYFMIILAACLALPAKAAFPALGLVAVLLAVGGRLFDIRPAIHGLGFLTHPLILEFAAGAVAAEYVRQRGSRVWGMLLCAFAIVGLVLGSTQHLWLNSLAVIWQKSFWAVIFAVGFGGLALLERSCQPERWWLQDHWRLGRASYSIFLSHGFVLMVGFAVVKPQMLGDDPFWMNVFLLFLVVLSVLFGLAVCKYWERPLLNFCKSLAAHFPLLRAGSDPQQTPQA
jgi:exopolysaccharide production protein ExoZ